MTDERCECGGELEPTTIRTFRREADGLEFDVQCHECADCGEEYVLDADVQAALARLAESTN